MNEPMSYRPDLLRDQIRALAENWSQADIKCLHAMYAEEHNLSNNVIGAVSAWVKIHADRLCASRSMVVSPGDFIEAYHYYSAQKTAGETLSLLAEVLNVEPEALAKMFSDYESLLFVEKPPPPLTTSESTDTSTTPELPADLFLSPPVGAALVPPDRVEVSVDYTFETKQLWREEIFQFLNHAIGTSSRKNLRVLCLPSPNPLPEIAIYDRLGIDRKNIIGVEGGNSDERRLFSRNAAEAGIQGIVGRLEEIVPQLNQKLDIVSLDFLGGLSETNLRMMKQIPLATKCWTITNVLARREK